MKPDVKHTRAQLKSRTRVLTGSSYVAEIACMLDEQFEILTTDQDLWKANNTPCVYFEVMEITNEKRVDVNLCKRVQEALLTVWGWIESEKDVFTCPKNGRR